MLGKSDLICFAATTNADAAKRFYTDVLGLTLTEDNPFALVFDSGGTMLRIQKVQEHPPAPFTALGWRVADIRAEIAALAAEGVAFNRYDGLTQDDMAIWTTPDGAMVAWFNDPDGSVLSLTQWPG